MMLMKRELEPGDIERDKRGLFLSQAHYIENYEKIVKWFNMINVSHISTPIDHHSKLFLTEEM